MQAGSPAAAVGAARPWLDRRVAGWALYGVASSRCGVPVPLLSLLAFIVARGLVLFTVDASPHGVPSGPAKQESER